MSNGGLKCELVGGKELTAKLEQLKSSSGPANRAGLYAVGCAILRDSLRRVPVDTGTLKGSGYVTLPQGDSGQCTVGYGGPAQAYAMVQHERLDYHHEVGEAKFLENAVQAVAPQAGKIFTQAMLKALKSSAQGTPSAVYPTDPASTPARGKEATRSKKGKR